MASTDELLKRLEEQHQAYLKTFRLIHEALSLDAQTKNLTVPTSPVSPLNPLSFALAPPTLAPPGSPRISHSRAPSRHRRVSNDRELEQSFRRAGTHYSSVFTGESDESETDGDLYVQVPLPSYSYGLEDLRNHLKTYHFKEAGRTLLKPVLRNGKLINPALFGNYPPDEKWHNSHYSVFDVDKDGSPLSRWEVVKPGTESIDSAIWQVIQDLNINPNTRTASGRIIVIREPSSLILGALHLTMNRDFDMDEIFTHLVEETGGSSAHMTNRAFKDDVRQQRSFIFSFDYYTVVGDEAQPMPWQRTDRPEKLEKKFDQHIHISRCTSVVALSLSGDHIKKLKNSARRAKTKHGFVYDPWAPWHVLNIQCYPDHKHSMDSHDSTKHYVNGTEAFLHTLLAELKDAESRFMEINVRITKLVTPEPDFMFDGSLRDKLLFEDQSFTYSRRYFWAYQTLGIMMNSIKSILDAYYSTFTSEVWEGKHRSLWPMVEEDSARNVYWRKRMMGLKKDFEKQIKRLNRLYEDNDDRRKEIRTLRDQLFSGTSVLESRKSVELSEVTILQGHNIKLLTLVSIFFLPLTFVTSVFGMSNMPQKEEFGVFGIVMSTVCIPFFLLIGSLNTTQGMRFWQSKWHQVLNWAMRKNKRDGNGKTKEENGGGDDERVDHVGQPVNGRPEIRKPHKRSLSTHIALQKRQEQIKPAESPSTTHNQRVNDRNGTLFTSDSLPGAKPDPVKLRGREGVDRLRSDPGLETVRSSRSAQEVKKNEKDKSVVIENDKKSWWERLTGRKQNRKKGQSLDV